MVLVGNPVVLGLFAKLSTTRLAYITVFDLFALMIVLLAIRHVRRGGRWDLVAAVVLLIAWPAVMAGAELAIVSLDEASVGAGNRLRRRRPR